MRTCLPSSEPVTLGANQDYRTPNQLTDPSSCFNNWLGLTGVTPPRGESNPTVKHVQPTMTNSSNIANGVLRAPDGSIVGALINCVPELGAPAAGQSSPPAQPASFLNDQNKPAWQKTIKPCK